VKSRLAQSQETRRNEARVFYTLSEVTARWDCSLSDLAGWAMAGRFDIVTGIEPMVADGHRLSGLVAVSVTDILPMFRRCGTGPKMRILRRVRPLEEKEWVVLPAPPDAIEVALADRMIMAADVRRFEEDCELLRRPPVRGAPGTTYDWDGMYVALIRRVHEHGVPASQTDWVSEVQDWFVLRTEGANVPDERTIRRRLTPIWRALRAPA
jgi:hypothetical protein